MATAMRNRGRRVEVEEGEGKNRAYEWQMQEEVWVFWVKGTGFLYLCDVTSSQTNFYPLFLIIPCVNYIVLG